MNNILANWWRSYQFEKALSQDDRHQAQQILQKILSSGARLSHLERLFQENQKLVQTNQELKQRQKHLLTVRRTLANSNFLPSVSELIRDISDKFKIERIEQNLIQCTGIDRRIFSPLEAIISDFLEKELLGIQEPSRTANFRTALQDLYGLKRGLDPNYSSQLSPHLYLIKYFLENVYCTYLAWFFVYQQGLLPSRIAILDVAAGPGTVAYGLSLFLQSCCQRMFLPDLHISYSSLEKQKTFQYRGLQVWRRYADSQTTPIPFYFQFLTQDIFEYAKNSSKIARKFFDFVVISHCFFADLAHRRQAFQIYQQIFEKHLKPDGCVFLIIQSRKLYKFYNLRPEQIQCDREERLVREFLNEMGLRLKNYIYISSTGSRTFRKKEFYQFAKSRLPKYESMRTIHHQYLGIKRDLHYAVDDYIILAQR
ncbi:MAG: photosystem II assembly protein [Cyanobacteria bacterium J055]|nr:MAG: photosystem II assembly protein [Cyanobacteria bacterium J055]